VLVTTFICPPGLRSTVMSSARANGVIVNDESGVVTVSAVEAAPQKLFLLVWTIRRQYRTRDPRRAYLPGVSSYSPSLRNSS